jgi:hypothetical protein
MWPVNEPNEDIFDKPGDESWAGQILEDLGYQGALPAVILQLLQKTSTGKATVVHITVSIGLAKISFESEPESTMLPFSREVQRDLRTCFNALEGIQCKQLNAHSI